MAKKVQKSVKLQIEAGKATPAPPIGTVLGPTGINMGEFCSSFNEKTKERAGEIVPVVLSIYEDRSFSFELFKPPISFLIKKEAGVSKGSGKNLIKRAGTLKKDQVRKIAEFKFDELNANTVEQAMKTVEGTALSMGISVE